MPIAYPVWFAGSVVALAGIAGLLLTHFGIVQGFRVISPILFGVAFGIYAMALGARNPIVVIMVFAIASVFFELVLYFNWLGLGTVV